MKIYNHIDNKKEVQPYYHKRQIDIKPYMFLGKFLWYFNSARDFSQPIVFMNSYLLNYIIDAEIQDNELQVEYENMNGYSSNNEYRKRYIWFKEYISNDEYLLNCINGINKMLRNHIRKHNMQSIDFDVVDTDDLKTIPYEQYLKTLYWAKLRKIALRIYGNNCRVCNSNKDIQLHHKSYNNRGNYKNELKDIIPLCSECHKKFHNL